MKKMTLKEFHEFAQKKDDIACLILDYKIAETEEEKQQLLAEHGMTEYRAEVECEVMHMEVFEEYWWQEKKFLKKSMPTTYEQVGERRNRFFKFLHRHNLPDYLIEDLINDLEEYITDFKVRQVLKEGVKEGDTLGKEILETAKKCLKEGQTIGEQTPFQISLEWALGRFPSKASS